MAPPVAAPPSPTPPSSRPPEPPKPAPPASKPPPRRTSLLRQAAPEPPRAPQPPPVDPELAARLAACTVACTAVVTGLADLPALAVGDDVLDVALVRMRVSRPEGEIECCVRQHVPPEVRAELVPGAGVMALAHQTDPLVAVVDWGATGDWTGSQLTNPSNPRQFDWPPTEDWPLSGQIEVYDVNGQREELERRRVEWRLASADLLAMSRLPTRVDARAEWRVTLELGGGNTIAIKDRVPMLAVARMGSGDVDRVGSHVAVLVSEDGDVIVDWEATLQR